MTWITCRHFMGMWPMSSEGRCIRPLSDRIDLIHGGLADHLDVNARRERRAGRSGLIIKRDRCGPDATYYQAQLDRPPLPRPTR